MPRLSGTQGAALPLRRLKTGGYNNLMSSAHTTHSTTRTLWIAIALGIITLVIEIIGGIKAGSLALLSDASHVFSDLLALGITLFALRLAAKPSTSQRTFGYHRAEIFGALINGLLLLIMAASISVEAWQRLSVPHEIKGGLVSLIGFIGIMPNVWTVLQLRKSENLNIKSAFLHALGDTFSSVAVVASGIAIAITGISAFDGVASFFVVLLLIVGAVRLLRQVVVIFLEGTPPGIDREKISKLVCALQGVRSTHDVHLWTLCSDVVYFTGHLVLDAPDLKNAQAVVSRATDALDKEGVHHVTLQTETPDHACTRKEVCEIIH